MKSVFSRFCDALFITRPIILIPVWAYFILGFYRAALAYHPDSFTEVPLFGVKLHLLTGFGDWASIGNLVMLTFSVAATYILNQLVDIETDRGNGGLPLLAKAGVSRKAARVEFLVLAAVPAVYAVLARGPVMVFLLSVLALNILYNVRPFYFTGRPFLDFISNAAGFGLVAFGLGFVSATHGRLVSLSGYFREAAPYVLLMAAGSINSTIPDEDGDRRTGKLTTVVLLGTRRANWISTAAVSAAFIFAMLNRDFVAGITACVSLPFFIKYLYSNNLKEGLATFQICGSFLMILTVFIFPWFFLWGLIVYVLTRSYFKIRHNVDYPKPGA